jgi:predicted nucleic acid-binding protein
MSRIRRVVLDTSTLVSAALRIGSVPHQALMQALASCDVCASAETLAELEQVLVPRQNSIRPRNRKS